MNDIEHRLEELETAYRETLARTLALETLCLAMLPTACPASDQLEAILNAADEALNDSLQEGGNDDAFVKRTLQWFRHMRSDAVFPAEHM